MPLEIIESTHPSGKTARKHGNPCTLPKTLITVVMASLCCTLVTKCCELEVQQRGPPPQTHSHLRNGWTQSELPRLIYHRGVTHLSLDPGEQATVAVRCGDGCPLLCAGDQMVRTGSAAERDRHHRKTVHLRNGWTQPDLSRLIYHRGVTHLTLDPEKQATVAVHWWPNVAIWQRSLRCMLERKRCAWKPKEDLHLTEIEQGCTELTEHHEDHFEYSHCCTGDRILRSGCTAGCMPNGQTNTSGHQRQPATKQASAGQISTQTVSSYVKFTNGQVNKVLLSVYVDAMVTESCDQAKFVQDVLIL